MSRYMTIYVDGQKTVTLSPYADMLNHNIFDNAGWKFSDEKQAYVVTAYSDIKEGEEIFFSYGLSSNHRYFFNYGFTDPDNNIKILSPILVSYNENDSLI